MSNSECVPLWAKQSREQANLLNNEEFRVKSPSLLRGTANEVSRRISREESSTKEPPFSLFKRGMLMVSFSLGKEENPKSYISFFIFFYGRKWMEKLFQ